MRLYPSRNPGHRMREYQLLVNSPKSGHFTGKQNRFFREDGSEIPSFMTPYGRGLTDRDLIEVTEYKNGQLIKWPVDTPDVPVDMPDRKESMEQSCKSRMNAAWTIGNAETDWVAMLTLTYPKTFHDSLRYQDVLKHRQTMQRQIRRKWPGTHIGWILEFSKAGAPHYHFFIGGTLAGACLASPTDEVTRKGNRTLLVRGPVEQSIINWWTTQAGDSSVEFELYQSGGILEILRTPEGAAAYVAKEAGKRVQKIAPWPVKAWWGLGPNEIRPRARGTKFVTVGDMVAANGSAQMIAKAFQKLV